MALLPIQIQMLENIKNKHPHLMGQLFLQAVQFQDADTADYIAGHYLDLLPPELKAVVQEAMIETVLEIGEEHPEDPVVQAAIQSMGEAIMAAQNSKLH